MKKLIKYFYPKHEIPYFDKLKTSLFIILGGSTTIFVGREHNAIISIMNL